VATALVLSLTLCAVGAALEGLFAGRGVKQQMASLRMPPNAPPFWVWMIIGGLYYVICFAVSLRLLLLPGSSERMIALVLLGILMFINALWNYFFFRARSPWRAYLLGWPYGAIVLALFALLWAIDRLAALFLLPYLVYLIYASAWSYRVAKLNPD
jgi:tryptophan-rich sensory protein